MEIPWTLDSVIDDGRAGGGLQVSVGFGLKSSKLPGWGLKIANACENFEVFSSSSPTKVQHNTLVSNNAPASRGCRFKISNLMLWQHPQRHPLRVTGCGARVKHVVLASPHCLIVISHKKIRKNSENANPWKLRLRTRVFHRQCTFCDVTPIESSPVWVLCRKNISSETITKKF